MQKQIRRYQIIGARRISNYIWILFIGLGSIAFFITGVVSFYNPLNFIGLSLTTVSFWPQGLVMSFYGLIGLIFSLYLGLTLLWNIGSGFNEFDLSTKSVRIFRWGFPGKNRRINLYYPFEDIENIRLEIKQGINPKRTIYLQVLGNRAIPLTRIGEPLSYEELENQAADLAKYLQVSLKLNK